MEQDKERRRSPRIKKTLTAQYGYKLQTGQIRWDMTIIKDISQTGIFISADRSFAVGETLYFRIKFPHKPFDWIEFKGRVIEVKAHGIITRVEFIELTEGQKKAIQEYVE